MEGSLVIGVKKRPEPGYGPIHLLEIPLDALPRHVCILGTTGAGKSTCASVLAYELGKRGIPTVILDRTGEYAATLGKLEGARVYRPGENLTTALFQREVERPLSVQVEGWVSLLSHYTMVSYGAPLSPLQQRVLRELLSKYYGGTNETLTISRLVDKLERYEEGVRQRGGWEESIEALISRLVPLTVDVVGKTLDRPYTDLKLEALFESATSILDLSLLGEDGAKNLLSQFILKRVYEKVRGMERTEEVRMVMVIDEAQHLAPNADYASIPERCAVELRKYGFSLVMVATRPSQVAPNVLANCNTIIAHMLTNERDLRTAVDHFVGGGDNRGMRDRLRTLRIGHAMVQLNHPEPSHPEVYRIGMPEHFDGLGPFSGALASVPVRSA